jgi:hypothetical protein
MVAHVNSMMVKVIEKYRLFFRHEAPSNFEPFVSRAKEAKT